MVKVLLAKGADINARSVQNHSAFNRAAYFGHTELSDYLKSQGAAMNEKEDGF